MAEQARSGERNFTQEQAEEILQRAAKLSGPSGLRPELSLSDLRKIAADAGIDPATIERVIAELDTKPSLSERIFLGAPLAIQLERTVDRDLPAAQFEHLLPEIQRILGDVGHISMLGNTMTWTSIDPRGASPTQVIVSRAGGKVVLRASARMSGAAGGLIGGIGGGVGGGFGGPVAAAVGNLTNSIPLVAATAIGIVGGALLLARTIYGAVVRAKERKLTRLLDRLSEVVRTLE